MIGLIGYADSDLKRCTKCRKKYPRSTYFKQARSKDGLYPLCRDCSNRAKKIARDKMTDEEKAKWRKQIKDWRKKNPEATKASGRRCELKRRFKITEDDFERILQRQGGVCAICKKPRCSRRNLSVDHDHQCCPGKNSCGKCIRGLLCHRCNMAIGGLGDSEETLTVALQYIRSHRAERRKNI